MTARPFHTLLVANRGEIACRVIRSARAAGLRTVAVFSPADADAPHVALADEAVCIGGNAPRESYLRPELILAAAAKASADAIHPGYGFLSENAGFAAAVEAAGLVFVGPTPQAIEAMGDKSRAKARMIAAGVPTVPGYQGEDQSMETLRREATRIGVPLLVKASAGGGGRGMRKVLDLAELDAALVSARTEAESAFGDGALLLERLVEGARHVEVQVFADAHGNVVHLGERDCSMQRRHQKVIEEAPSPAVDAALRAKMGAAAVAAAQAIAYRGAGTVEFLLGNDGQFYFLEMNTRLQVEHPVTEEVTGLDLVTLQLDVAAGRTLPFTQDDVALKGHAIEVRLYAEDPWAGYMPQTGPVLAFAPDRGPGVRVDAGVRPGQRVTEYYDPMIAKVITFGRDREEARRKLVLALRRSPLLGVRHNKRFLEDLLSTPTFVEGQATTAWLDGPDAAPLLQRPASSDVAWAIAATLVADGPSGAQLDGFRNAHEGRVPLPLRLDDVVADVEVEALRAPKRGANVRRGSSAFTVELASRTPLEGGGELVRVRVDGHERSVFAAWSEGGTYASLWLEIDGIVHVAAEEVPRGGAKERAGDGRLRAPTSGRVTSVRIAVGDRVKKGQIAVTLEAMKIESAVVSDVDGEVLEVNCSAGQQVENRKVIVVIRPDAAPSDASATPANAPANEA